MSENMRNIDQHVSVSIATDMRDKILLGVLPQGARLRQREIAKEYGVSLMPARDAIKKLVRDGLAIRPTPKTFVIAPTSAADFIEVMELRMTLEPQALERSAPRLTADELKQLRNILALQNTNSTAIETATNHWNFHQLLYSRMGRPRTLEIIEKLNLHLNRYLVPIWTTVGIKDDWVDHHAMLIDLIEEGKIKEAADELKGDIDETLLRVVKDGLE